MPDYLPGSFFLTQIGGPTGFAIGVAQALCGDASRYQHAGIVLNSSGLILEAEPGGARLGMLSQYEGRPLLISDAPVQRNLANWRTSGHPPTSLYEAALRNVVLGQARKLVGVPYSALDYAALAALHLHLPSGWIRRRVESSGHMQCAQLVDAVFARAGIHLFDDGRLPGDVLPADLAAYAEDHAAGGAS